MDDPQADAISLANLADCKCSGGKRRAGDAMLEPDPAYDADREGRNVVEDARDILDDLIADFVDILIANEDEANAYTGH